MIDIHCHLLPSIDDGPATLDAALRLARHAVASGIEKSVVTPHIMPGRYDNSLQQIREAVLRFGTALATHQIALELGYAAEIRIGPEVMGLVQEDQLPALGSVDGYRIVLLEFPDSHILPGSDKLVGWLLDHKNTPTDCASGAQQGCDARRRRDSAVRTGGMLAAGHRRLGGRCFWSALPVALA